MASLQKRRGVWHIKFRGPDGKIKFKSCGKDAAKGDARLILAEYTRLEFNWKHKKPIKAVEITLPDALGQFNSYALKKEHKARNSLDREQTIIRQFQNYVAEKGWQRFKDADIQAYLDDRKEQGRKPNTLIKDKRLINKFFRWAISMHYCLENPAEDAIVPKIRPKTPRYFSKEEIEKILNASKPPYTDIYRFMLHTGMRSGEIACVEWTHWDQEQQFLLIPVVDGDRQARKCGTKTKREGIIPLNLHAEKILKRRYADPNRHEKYIFTNEAGNPLDNDNIFRNLKRILDKENIKTASPHTWRHTFASHLAIQGVSLFVIKDLLRHSDIKQTQIYAHLSDEVRRHAVRQLTVGSEKMKVAKAQTIDLKDVDI